MADINTKNPYYISLYVPSIYNGHRLAFSNNFINLLVDTITRKYKCSIGKKSFNGNGSTTAFLILKVVLHVVVVISKVLRLNTKSRCSHWCRAHLYPEVGNSILTIFVFNILADDEWCILLYCATQSFSTIR